MYETSFTLLTESLPYITVSLWFKL